ncbi:MAG: 3',5'-cyclic-AMP phosphodiesterase [Flammeovirgaceae bacterium]
MQSKFLFSILQISDLHLLATQEAVYRNVQPAKTLFLVVRYVLAKYVGKDGLTLPFDVMLISGDVSEDQSLNSYILADQMLRPLDLPKLWLAGNHDHWQTMQKASQKARIKAFKTIDKNGVLLILLNSSALQQDYGMLEEGELQYLNDTLAKNPQKTTIIALHHHPLPVDTSWMDKYILQNSQDFFNVIDKHPQVKAVLFGHIHSQVEMTRNGVKYWSCPSTSVQFKLCTPTFETDKLPVGFSIIRVDEKGEIHREVIRVSEIESSE